MNPLTFFPVTLIYKEERVQKKAGGGGKKKSCTSNEETRDTVTPPLTHLPITVSLPVPSDSTRRINYNLRLFLHIWALKEALSCFLFFLAKAFLSQHLCRRHCGILKTSVASFGVCVFMPVRVCEEM